MPLLVVVLGQSSDGDARMIEAHEQGLVEQLVAHATVERLRIAVLHRLAGSDVMPVDPSELRKSAKTLLWPVIRPSLTRGLSKYKYPVMVKCLFLVRMLCY